jgi:hypothetical protein
VHPLTNQAKEKAREASEALNKAEEELTKRKKMAWTAEQESIEADRLSAKDVDRAKKLEADAVRAAHAAELTSQVGHECMLFARWPSRRSWNSLHCS